MLCSARHWPRLCSEMPCCWLQISNSGHVHTTDMGKVGAFISVAPVIHGHATGFHLHQKSVPLSESGELGGC